MHSFISVATICLASLWLLDTFGFPFPGGCRFRVVSANPYPGESDYFGLGRERSSSSGQDRVWKDCCVRCTCHPAHPFLQTGKDNTNFNDKWFPLSHQFSIEFMPLVLAVTSLSIFPSLCPPYHCLCFWCHQSVSEQDVRALVLVPTKELGQQVQTMIRQLTAYCSRDVRVADISGKADLSAQRSDYPDIVKKNPSLFFVLTWH